MAQPLAIGLQSVGRMETYAVSPRRQLASLTLLAATMLVASCVAPKMRSTLDRPPTAAEMAQLWAKPADIAARDLYWGPGGEKWAPKAGTTFKIVDVKTSGTSPGVDVEDPTTGITYGVKLGPESQTEVVVSRLLWAVGYHQPPTYTLNDYELTGDRPPELPKTGRFRPKLGDEFIDAGDNWSWHENPFVGTREFKALLVMQLVFNNWDLKTAQNVIYDVQNPGKGPKQWYVVRDVGAALGRTDWPVGSKNNPDDFESQSLLDGVENGTVDFNYHGRHKELFDDITVADVVWAAELMNGITPKQYADAFRAAGYPEDIAARFIAKIRSKVQEGLDLKKTGAAR
jgi:hypothetical protein